MEVEVVTLRCRLGTYRVAGGGGSESMRLLLKHGGGGGVLRPSSAASAGGRGDTMLLCMVQGAAFRRTEPFLSTSRRSHASQQLEQRETAAEGATMRLMSLMREEKASAPAASRSTWSPPRQPALSPWRNSSSSSSSFPSSSHFRRSAAAPPSPGSRPDALYTPASSSGDLGSVLVCIPAAKTHLHLGGADDIRRPSLPLGSPILAAQESAFSPTRLNLSASSQQLLPGRGVQQPRGFGSKLIPYRCAAAGYGFGVLFQGSGVDVSLLCHSNSSACK